MKDTILKGEKVILRKHQLKDAGNYMKWLKDKEINKFLGSDGKGLTLEDEKKFIRSSWRTTNKKYFAITVEEKTIGTIDLHIDNKHKSAELGIFIGDKNYQNNGYGTDAVKIILKYGFKKLNLNRIDLEVYDFNKRAQKAFKKVGFQTEGLSKEKFFKDNKFTNAYNMAILKPEWEKKYGKS